MKFLFQFIVLFVTTIGIQNAAVAGFIIDHEDTNIFRIPIEWIIAAKADLHIAYNHTSHGSHLVTGLRALRAFPAFGSTYNWVNTSIGDSSHLSLDNHVIPGIPDLSQGDYEPDNDGIAKWAKDTYSYLDSNDNLHINVVMWAWCDIAEHNIPRYLNSMEWLIQLFGENGSHVRAANHPVQFVFMTAHANGGGEGDSSDSANELIRRHCLNNNRILYDFSDMENYDPDNNYFLDKRLDDALYYDSTPPYDVGERDANWASEYLARYPGSIPYLLTNGTADYPGCGKCAHSPNEGETADARLNCILKGMAAWALFARLAGWDGNPLPPSPPLPSDPSPYSYLPPLYFMLNK